jgi:hypothetical protein
VTSSLGNTRLCGNHILDMCVGVHTLVVVLGLIEVSRVHAATWLRVRHGSIGMVQYEVSIGIVNNGLACIVRG